MILSPFTWLFANFARILRTSTTLLLIVPCAMFPNLDLEKRDTNDEYRLRWIVVTSWLYSTLLFAALNSLRFFLVGKTIQMPRDQKIRDLRIGVVGLLICTLVQFVTCFFMRISSGTDCRYVAYGYAAAMPCITLFVLDQCYMCKFPNKYKNGYNTMMMFTVGFGIDSFFLDKVNRFEMASYMSVIGTLLIDGYILFFHSSEIHFLGDFLEKLVDCKDKEGNEWRGQLASVDANYKKRLFLRLKLINVEKLRNGKYVEHPGTVYIDEIESLELAKVESIEKCQKCHKKKKTA